MSETERCGAMLEKHPTKPYLIAVCTRPSGHDGEHCSVLHKPFDRTCPTCCAPTPAGDSGGERE